MESNPALHTIGGFQSLDAVDGAIVITANYGLGGSLSGFSALVHAGSLAIAGNHFLSVSGFSQLHDVAEDVVLWSPSATSVPTFPALASIDGDLTVTNSGMGSLTGYEALHTIGGNLLIAHHNGTGGAFSGFGALRSVGTLEIVLSNFVSIDGFEQLEVVDGDLIVDDNPALATVTAFGALTAVHGNLSVKTNPRFCLDRVDAAFPETLDVAGRQIVGNGTEHCGLAVSGTVTTATAASARSCTLRVVAPVGGVCSPTGAVAASAVLPGAACPTSPGTVPFTVTDLYRTSGESWADADVCFFLEVHDGGGNVLVAEPGAAPRSVSDADAVTDVAFPAPVAPAPQEITVGGDVVSNAAAGAWTCTFEVYEAPGSVCDATAGPLVAHEILGASCTLAASTVPYSVTLARTDAAAWSGSVCFAMAFVTDVGPVQRVYASQVETAVDGGSYTIDFIVPASVPP
jgi:hypothetical protein